MSRIPNVCKPHVVPHRVHRHQSLTLHAFCIVPMSLPIVFVSSVSTKSLHQPLVAQVCDAGLPQALANWFKPGRFQRAGGWRPGRPHLPVARVWQIFPSGCDLSHRQAARKCARGAPTFRSREQTGDAHALLHGYRHLSRHWPHLVGRRDYQARPSGKRGPPGTDTAAHHHRGAGQERFGLLNSCVSCARTLEIVAEGCQAPSAKLTASSFLSATGL
jgi:hypothetical protein